MATWMSNELLAATQGMTSLGGIKGGPQQNRGAQDHGGLQVGIATFTNPASSGLAEGDLLELIPLMFPTDRFVSMLGVFGAFGSSVTASFGKIDPNNSPNTDAAHYLAASSIASATTLTADVNLGEQVGADPAGDDSTGNAIPGYGAQSIIPTITFGGATPAASKTVLTIITFLQGSN